MYIISKCINNYEEIETEKTLIQYNHNQQRYQILIDDLLK
jgi:hypothetical protein